MIIIATVCHEYKTGFIQQREARNFNLKTSIDDSITWDFVAENTTFIISHDASVSMVANEA